MERETGINASSPYRASVRKPGDRRLAGIEFDTPGFVEHLAAYQETIAEGDRRIVAIAGPPGSGKTTLAG
ncbi:MAG: hypothetical protein ACC726_16060, partial [Chloroflexota bacterium]